MFSIFDCRNGSVARALNDKPARLEKTASKKSLDVSDVNDSVSVLVYREAEAELHPFHLNFSPNSYSRPKALSIYPFITRFTAH